MFASVSSFAIVGVTPVAVTVEAGVGRAGGTPRFSLVGLPDTAVREAKERVRSAMAAAGFAFPPRNVTVNLSPADLPKAGAAYDLPIALAVIAACGFVEPGPVVACGELALDGRLRPVRGALGCAVVGRDLRRRSLVPAGSGSEGWGVAGAQVHAVSDLAAAVDVAFHGAAGGPDPSIASPGTVAVDLSEIRGMVAARRAAEVAAAGGHHMLLSGPPGSGKTMLARAVPGLLPPLSAPVGLEVALGWAAAGRFRGVDDPPPFRAPHHSASLAAMVGGGGGVPTPGEVTLAHGGVLFLDELGEFPSVLLDALRQPIEDGSLVVARKAASVRFPSRFQLVAATNPCPCGYRGDRLVACSCPPAALERYERKLSGPLADRVDLRVRVPRVDRGDLLGPPGESSREVRERVIAARKRQHGRHVLNRELTRDQIDELEWDPAATRMLGAAFGSLALSARGWHRVRRVAVTVADLDESEVITADHVGEALAFRGAS